MLGMDFSKMQTVLRHYRKDVWPGKPLNRDFTVSRLDEFVKKELPSYGGVFGDHYTVCAFDQLMEKYVSIHTDHVQFLVRKDRGVSRLMSAARVDDDAAANLGKGEALWLRDPAGQRGDRRRNPARPPTRPWARARRTSSTGCRG